MMSQYVRVQSDSCDDEKYTIRGIAHLIDSVELPTGTLVECVYLGSCITTREDYQRQMTDLDTNIKSPHAGKEYYVKLLIGPEKLGIDDCNTGERLHGFNYQDILNIDTHPMHPQRLTFITSHTQRKVHCHVFQFDRKEVAKKIALILNVFEKVKKFRALRYEDEFTSGSVLMQLIEDLMKFVAVEYKNKPAVDISWGLSYIESKIKESQLRKQAYVDIQVATHRYRESEKAQPRKLCSIL